MAPLSVIFGLKGPKLSDAEKLFFRDVNPWGFILFARNIETPEQVQRLTADLKDAVGREALIFIDQEGGRVQRLRPPHWPIYPAGADYLRRSPNMGQAQHMAFWAHRLIADDLRKLGITANCAPVLDLPAPNADPIIGDRAFSKHPQEAILLANAAIAGLMEGGVAPVIKHIPGHGRAEVDSHLALPLISTDLDRLAAHDFIPFKAFADAPMAMTAHVTLEKEDATAPVTLSRKAMDRIVRGELGYDGLVMTDDLDMKALKGDLRSLTEKALKAGCDIALHCDGEMPKMVRVAAGARPLSGQALRRAIIAENCAGEPALFDVDAARRELSDFMGYPSS